METIELKKVCASIVATFSEAVHGLMDSPLVTPDKIVAELVRLARASAGSTQGLRYLSHEDVCLAVQSQLELIGDYFLKYHQIAYKVQGPRDQGVDVLLRISSESDTEKYVAFQVKSYEELEDRNNTLSKLLKAGYHDAIQHYTAIDRYYILLCGDPISHEKRISAITAEFVKSSGVVMVFPAFVKNFLDMEETTISSTVDHFLRSEDFVVKQARRELGEKDELILKANLACLSCAWNSADEEIDTSMLLSTYDLTEEEIEALEDRILATTVPGKLKVMPHDFPAVRALYYDMQVRYGYDPRTLVMHLTKLLSR